MSTVTAAEVEALLTEHRARKAALVAGLAEVTAVFDAAPSLENFRLFYRKHAELDRQSTRLVLLENWAAGLRRAVAV